MIPLSAFFPPPPPPGQAGDVGMFGPGSAAWRIARERLLLAGGPAALLLQVAHPLVAAGVAAHSDFSTDPLRRLRSTMDTVMTMTFGDSAQVRDAARYVAARHRPVRGTLPVTTGPFPAGTPSRADDPELALWVLATLVWVAVEVTDGFAGPVPAAEREAYHRDMGRLARLFGVPASVLPRDYRALERYVEHQVDDVLAVGPAATQIAAGLLRPDPPLLPAVVRPVPALLAAGVLPPRVREAYGLRWRGPEQVAFHAARRATRRVLPLLPARARYWPHYLVAAERVRRGEAGA